MLETHWSRWEMITRIARKVNHKSAELPSRKICVDVYHINPPHTLADKKTITGGKYSRRFILLTKYGILANDEFDAGAKLTF